MKLSALLILLCCCLSGCGYHFSGGSGVLPAEIEKLYVPLFVNLTAEPQLEQRLTTRVSEVFSRNSEIIQVEKIQFADAVLLGTINDYHSQALAYDRNDAIGMYRATMSVNVFLRKIDTKETVWEKNVRWSQEYRAEEDKGAQEDFERQAIEEVSLRLAEEIYYQLFDAF